MRRETRVQLVLPDVHGEKLQFAQRSSVNTTWGKLEAGAVHPPPRTPAGEDPWADWVAATQVCEDAKWQCQGVAPVTLAYLGPPNCRREGEESKEPASGEQRVREGIL